MAIWSWFSILTRKILDMSKPLSSVMGVFLFYIRILFYIHIFVSIFISSTL